MDSNVPGLVERSNPVTEFFERTFTESRSRLSTHVAPTAAEIASATHYILDYERDYRQSLAGDPPAPALAAVEWGARSLYRATQFLVYRELGPELLTQELSLPCPEVASPAVCYGVDLTFRFLPDLMRLARATSPEDLLVKRLSAWAGAWPLSSVSIPAVTVQSIDGFINDRSLRMLYVDRIIAAKDFNRLQDPRVREAVQGALGAFPECAAEIAAALERKLPNSP